MKRYAELNRGEITPCDTGDWYRVEDVHAEIKTAGKRGLVRITDLTGGVEPEPEKPTATEDAGNDEAKTTSKRRK